jgi:hypothetical protein
MLGSAQLPALLLVGVFLGIGFKFNDFIQAIHASSASARRFPDPRARRCGSTSSTPRPSARSAQPRAALAQHDEQMAIMTASSASTACPARPWRELQRSMTASTRGGLGRGLAAGEQRHGRRDGAHGERQRRPDRHQHPVLDAVRVLAVLQRLRPHRRRRHFFQQMDFLIPQLFRVLKPGRVPPSTSRTASCRRGLRGSASRR